MFQTAVRQEEQITKSGKGELYKKALMLGAVGGILLGILCSLIGIFLSIEIFLINFESHQIETVFLVSSFGFLALGAHCMDKIDQVRKAERIARCRRIRTTDENCN